MQQNITLDNPLGALKILEKCGVLRHFADVLPLLFLGKSHYIKYPIQLVVVIWVGGLNVFLPTVEDGFRGQQLRKDAADGPYVWQITVSNK
jgi:hypothetical protein